jgi:hypothetical protein
MNTPHEHRQQRRRIGVLDIAIKLGCHPASVPRLVKEKRLPPPDKLLNKNQWWEHVIDAVIARGIPPRPKKEGAGDDQAEEDKAAPGSQETECGTNGRRAESLAEGIIALSWRSGARRAASLVLH